jgi:hypothetical protein
MWDILAFIQANQFSAKFLCCSLCSRRIRAREKVTLIESASTTWPEKCNTVRFIKRNIVVLRNQCLHSVGTPLSIPLLFTAVTTLLPTLHLGVAAGSDHIQRGVFARRARSARFRGKRYSPRPAGEFGVHDRLTL